MDDDDDDMAYECQHCGESPDYTDYYRPNNGDRLQCPACGEWTELD